MRVTRAEWQRLESALEKLPSFVRNEVERRIRDTQKTGPVVCPFLDPAAGACLVYEHRPVACRTYGFYRSRDGGRFCRIVQDKVDREGDVGIVWGNHEVIERRLERSFGPAAALSRWLNV